jgi:hypothetical protein
MTTSTNIRGLAKHINQIFNTSEWDGIDMTLRKKTVVTDPNGKIVSISNTDSTIKGVISGVPTEYLEASGKLEDRRIRGIFLWTGSVATMPEIEDRIINDTIGSATTYVVIAIPYLDYDIDTPVLMTCDLRKVPNED